MITKEPKVKVPKTKEPKSRKTDSIEAIRVVMGLYARTAHLVYTIEDAFGEKHVTSGMLRNILLARRELDNLYFVVKARRKNLYQTAIFSDIEDWKSKIDKFEEEVISDESFLSEDRYDNTHEEERDSDSY